MAVPPWKTWTALGLVYVVWGSTYLAIRYVVDGMPPLLSASARFAAAAAVLAVWVAVRRGRAPFAATRRQWLSAGVVGLLLLLGGNGLVMLAEDADLPSGLAALLVAGVPLWVVVGRWLLKDRATVRTVVGVCVGLVGLAVLLLPGSRPQGVALGAAALVVCASMIWSVGSVLAPRLDLPADGLVVTVGEMAGGAVGLAVVGALRGESPVLHDAPASAWVGWVYLVVFGSVVAFTAYSWLLQTAPVSQVATYAYVNPVVAVALGAAIAGEDVTATSLVGGQVTLVAVYLVVTEEGRHRRTAEPSVVAVGEPAAGGAAEETPGYDMGRSGVRGPR
jgi:drug/metabolite transporter (DMT)-like permease